MKSNLSSIMMFAALCLAAAGCASLGWEQGCEEARNRPRPIIFYNDGDDLGAPLKSTDKTAMAAEYLARRAPGITVHPAAAVFFTVNYEFKPENSVLKALWQLRAAGLDDVHLQLDYARSHGVEFFADYRFNDVHDDLDRPDKPFPWMADFKRRHPELLFGSWDKLPPVGTWSYLDFDAPAVREYVFGELRMIAEKYDIDGLNIDFGREPSIFRTVAYGDDATSSQLDLMTAWMTEVKEMLDAIGHKRGHPIMLSVRVPDSVGYCRAIGIDLEKWLQKGLVDLLVTGVNFRFNPWGYSAKLAQKYHRPFYASIDYPEFHPINVESPLTRLASASFAGRAATALAAGADGILYFNVMSEGGMRAKVTPEAKLAQSPKLYHLTDRWLYKPERHLKEGSRFCSMPLFHPREPKEWHDTAVHEFVLEYSGEKYKSPDDLVYALAEGWVTPDDGLVITSNGKEWPLVGRKMTCLIYAVPDGALKEGPNRIKFQLKPDATAQLSDFGVRCEPNPGKLTPADLVKKEARSIDSIAYRAADGKLPSVQWASTYGAENVKLIRDGKMLLRLENSDRPNRWQVFSIADKLDAAALGDHVLIRCRVRMARSPQKPATGFFCLGANLLHRGRVYVFAAYFLADNQISTTNNQPSFKLDYVTQMHDYAFDVDAANALVTVSQDGRKIGSWSLLPAPSSSPGGFFGDGASRVEGAADLDFIEFRQIK